MLKTSTGLRNKMLDTSPLRSLLNLGFIKIYSGPVPVSADDAIDVANTLLCTISSNDTGTGITFEAVAADGIVSKAAAEVWSGTPVAAGVATFYRHVSPSDDGLLSTVQPRLQGEIATVGADMNLSNTTFNIGVLRTIDFYEVAIPTV